MNPTALELAASIKPISHWNSGEASFKALTQLTNKLAKLTSEEYGVILETKDGLSITEISYYEPHTFMLSGVDQQGNDAHDLIHYSQLNLRMTKVPKESGVKKHYGFRIHKAG